MCQIKLIIINNNNNNNNNNDNNITFCLKCGIKDIFGSKNAKVQKFQKIYYYILLKFYVMTGMLGCIIPCTWVKARLQLLIQLPFKN